MSDTASPARHASLALWRVAEAFLRTLHALFGAPEEIAAEHTLVAKTHRLIASWLRCAEAMLRRLLLIEASFYPKPNIGPLLHAAKLFGRQRARKLIGFTADKPEAWRVSFRCFSASDRRLPAGTPAHQPAHIALAEPCCRLEAGGPRRFRSAWPLAERYEALIRVFNDPTAYARRLARRLHATPHRLREALRAPPEAEHRIDCFEELTHEAGAAWRPHFSSA